MTVSHRAFVLKRRFKNEKDPKGSSIGSTGGTGRASGTKLGPVLLDGPERENEKGFRKQTLNGPKRRREANREETGGVRKDSWSWR